MIWENGIETCVISYMKQVSSPGSMHDTGCLGLVHWDDPEGWYGEGEGFRMGNTCIPVADSFWYMAKPRQYCKVKKNNKNIKKKLYAHKFDNLEETDQLHERQSTITHSRRNRKSTQVYTHAHTPHSRRNSIYIYTHIYVYMYVYSD